MRLSERSLFQGGAYPFILYGVGGVRVRSRGAKSERVVSRADQFSTAKRQRYTVL